MILMNNSNDLEIVFFHLFNFIEKYIIIKYLFYIIKYD